MVDPESQAIAGSRVRALGVWLLAAVLPLFAILPAVTTPVEDYAIDTSAFHIYRTVVFSEARAESGLLSGGLLPRWTQPTDGGLGGPLFAYTPTLMYFLMDGFHTLGLDYVYTWRAVIAFMLVVASVGMFGLARALFQRLDAAYLSAAAFVYAPLLLRDFIERGSPQAIGVALFPWVLWAVLRLVRRPSGINFVAAAVAWGVLIFAHNLSALLLAPVIGLLVIFTLWAIPRPTPSSSMRMGRAFRGGTVILALAAGSLLVAFYVFPVFAELQYIQIDNPQHTTHAYPPDNPTPLRELFALPPVFDTGLGNNTMGAGIGLFYVFITSFVLVVFAITLPLFWSVAQDTHSNPGLRQYNILSLFLLSINILGALAIWLQTDSATPVWRTLDFLDVLQFRFRLLSLFTLAAALDFGWLITFLTKLSRSDIPDQTTCLSQEATNITITILSVTIIASLFSLYPDLMQRYTRLPEDLTSEDVKQRTIQTNTASLAAFNEYVPIWRHMPFTQDEMQRAADSPIANLPEGAIITQDSRKTTTWKIALDTPEAFTAAFYLLYYPGWEARIDGKERPIRPADEDEIYPNTGYLLLDVPAGSHTITLDYAGTTAQHTGDRTSILMALLLVGIAIRWWWARRNKPRPNPEHRDVSCYPSARATLFAVLVIVLLAGNKTIWLDQTHELLYDSTCDSIHDVNQYPPVEFGPYRLCGYDLDDTTLKAGAMVNLVLYWQIDGNADRSATNFVHLVGEVFNPQTGTPVWGGRDHRTPGNHPTSEWTPGKLYRDEYHFNIPDHTPPGTYPIEIGWTYWDDGARIPPILIERNTPQPETPVVISEWESLLLTEIIVR
jgi:hypothetical protein